MKRRVTCPTAIRAVDRERLLEIVGARNVEIREPFGTTGAVPVLIRCDPEWWNQIAAAVRELSWTKNPTAYEDLIFTRAEILGAELCSFAPRYTEVEPAYPEHGFDLRLPARPGVPPPWCWYKGRLIGRRAAYPDQRRCIQWTYAYEHIVSDYFLEKAAGCDLSAVTTEPIFDRRTDKPVGWSQLRGTRNATLRLDKCEGVTLEGHILHDPPIPVVHRTDIPAHRFAATRSSVASPSGGVPDAIFLRELGPDHPQPPFKERIPPTPRLLVGPKVCEILLKHMKSRAKLEPVWLV